MQLPLYTWELAQDDVCNYRQLVCVGRRRTLRAWGLRRFERVSINYVLAPSKLETQHGITSEGSVPHEQSKASLPVSFLLGCFWPVSLKVKCCEQSLKFIKLSLKNGKKKEMKKRFGKWTQSVCYTKGGASTSFGLAEETCSKNVRIEWSQRGCHSGCMPSNLL